MKQALIYSFIFVSICFTSCKQEPSAKKQQEKKSLNVVLILTDDQGYHLSALEPKAFQHQMLINWQKKVCFLQTHLPLCPHAHRVEVP